MTMPLPHAAIITAEVGVDLSEYIDTVARATDEVIRINDHLNTSKTSTGIYIEDVRDLQVTVRAAKSGIRTLVALQDASKMTTQAQNALLKLLEEPRDGLYILLLTHAPMQLLETIRSRCQTLHYTPAPHVLRLPEEKAARIRFMAAGSEYEAKRLVDDARYFEQRSKLFEAAKEFAGASRYDRLSVVRNFGGKRDDAVAFVDACIQLYTALLKNNFSERLHTELSHMLAVDEAIRMNANVKLQLLKLALG